MTRMMLLIACLVFGSFQALGRDCEKWNSESFFKQATVEIVTGCLEAGADLEVRNDQGKTPLHMAARFNEDAAVVTALLEAGADLTARDDFGATPFHLSGGNENPAIVTVLLEAGADPKERTAQGWTPLHYTARGSRSPAVLDVLVKAGVDPAAGNNFSARNALHWSVISNPFDSGSDKTAAFVSAFVKAGGIPTQGICKDELFSTWPRGTW